MVQQDPLDLLTAWIIHEKRVVTYRLLSRESGIQVKQAKSLLKQFHEQNATSNTPVHATYLVAGFLPSTLRTESKRVGTAEDMAKNDMQVDSKPLLIPIHTLALVAEQDLEMRQKEFKSITSIHIYSLEPTSLKDSSPIAAANLLIYSEEKYVAAFEKSSRGELYGYIKNPDVKIVRDGLRPVNVKSALKHKPAMTSTKPTDIPSADPTAKPNKPSASFWGKSAEIKSKQSSASASTPASKPQPSSKGTKRKGGESNPDEEEQDRKLAAASIDHDVEMDQAGDDQEDDDPEATARRQKEADDLEAMMMDADDDQLMAAATEAVAKPETELPRGNADTTPKTDRKRVRKTRKVLKKKTSKNERGYLVTEDVWETESYSEDEGVSGKEASTSPAIRPDQKVPTKKASAGQANLMSFFGRNK